MSLSTPETTAASAKPSADEWGTRGYDGPQPWDHDALEMSKEAHELSKSPIGAANTISPTITHSHPTLTSGSAHPAVHELGRKLGDLGYPNSVSKGENPFGHVDESIIAAVDAFRSAYNVQEDPTGFGGSTPAGRRIAEAHIGPWTIEGILAAHAHHAQ